jgi:hypothetical protein
VHVLSLNRIFTFIQRAHRITFVKMADYRDVFLGGTCGEFEWRKELISKLDKVTYFDPVVTNRLWTREDEEIENMYKETCEYNLYVITPKMVGFYSIAEAVNSSHKKPGKTIFCVLETDGKNVLTDVQKKSLKCTERLLLANNAIVKHSLDEVANFLNHIKRKPKICCVESDVF